MLIRIVLIRVGDRRCRCIAVDPHVASQFDLMCARIVLSVIGINIRVAHVNCDVVPRCCQSVFICRFSSGRDFNRDVLLGLDLSPDETDARKEGGEQQNRLSHRGRRTYRSKAFLQSQKRSVPGQKQLRAAQNSVQDHGIDNRKPATC